jgi:hypothetical protein
MKKQVLLLILTSIIFTGKVAGVGCGVTDPSDLTVCRGSSFSLSVTASGGSAYTYKWQYSANGTTGWADVVDATPSGMTYSGGTSSSLTVTANGSEALTNYYYRCVVDGSGCSASNSGKATITVVSDPSISVNPVSPSAVCIGGSLSALTVTASGGTPSKTYQWFSNTTNSNSGGTNLGAANGAQTNSYTPPTNVAGTLYYYCVVSASGLGCDAASSTTATVVVNPQPTATAGGSQSICHTGTATVSGAISSNGTILWTHDGAGTIADETTLTPTYTAAAGDAGNTVTLTMTVSNSPCTPATATYAVHVDPAPTASAGGNQTICQTGSAIVSGASSSNGTILWTSDGAGALTNETTLTPTYTAAAGDAENTVTLTMTVTSNCDASTATATYTVYVKGTPTATAGGSQTICQTGSAIVSGATSSNGSILWTSNGFGSLTDATTLTPTYNAVVADAGNTVTLTMTVSNSPCTNATATYTVHVDPSPTATAGGSQDICESGTATVSGASASNGTILWTTGGTGILSNETTDHPTYAPGVGEAGTTVTLTMTVTSNNTCTPATATASYTVNVKATPTATAGGSQTICQTGTATVSGATSSNGSILWTSNGFGSLTDATTLTPTYNAVAADAGNTVTLTITVSNSPCTAATATYTVHVDPSPTATAGGSQDICESGTATVSGASASNGTILWTTSGTGILSNETTDHPTYAPGVGEAGTTVTLTMTVTSNNTCTPATATASYTVNIKATPTATAGGSQTICQTGSATVSGATSSNGSILWTSNGSGSITGATSLTPTYNAVAADAGSTITLTMTVSNSPCTAATASFTVHVDPSPVATAGGSQDICESGTAIVSGASASNGTILWTHNGHGALTDETTDHPTYTPGSGDAETSVTLTMTVTSSNICNPATATAIYTVNVKGTPTATAGGSQTICQTGTATVSGATSSYGAILWTSDGSGSITGATTLTPTYNAVAADGGHTVTLTMTVSNPPCASATATYTVNVKATPTATAGGSQTICQTGSAIVSGATAANGTLLWTHNGLGTLTNETTLTPTYSAVAADAGNTITLTLTVSNAPCTSATATYTVLVDKLPTAAAGGNQTICSSGTAVVSGASASDGTILWTHNGSGSLSNATTLTPTYNAVAGDAGNTVILTMTVTSNNTCNPTTTTAIYTVYVNQIAQLNDPADQVLCNGGPTTLVTFVSTNTLGVTTFSWTNNTTSIGLAANGSNDNIPSFNAQNSGNSPVTATITVAPTYTRNLVGCPGPSQSFTITVNPTEQVDQPGNQTICNGGTTTAVNFTTANSGGSTTFNWTNNAPSIGLAASGNGNIGAFTGLNSGNAPVVATITVYPMFTNGVSCSGSSKTFTITVNPTPTLTGASQAAVICEGAKASINLLGLLPNVTSTVAFSINGVPQSSATNVVSNGSGSASFLTPILSASNNGQILRVTGVTTTTPSPSCSASFTVDVALSVNAATLGGTVAADQSICSNTSPADLVLSGNTGTVIGWEKSTDGFSHTTPISLTAGTLPGAFIGNLLTTTSFRAVVQSGVCASTQSGSATVTVKPLPVPTITGVDSVNVNSTGIGFTTETARTSYIWTVSGAGNSVSSGGGTYSVGTTWNTQGDQTISVNYQDNGCPAASPTSKNVHVNARPVASGILAYGTTRSGLTLSAIYSYSDAESNNESGTTFQWYKADNASGSGIIAIPGATQSSYLLVDGDTLKYIRVTITPGASWGATPGNAVNSNWVGPVVNSAPVASSVSITGSKNVGGVLTGHYTYSDVENDLESGSEFKWYSSNTLSGTYNEIPGETSNIHVIADNEQALFFKFSVRPKAATGRTNGNTVFSSGYGPANSKPYADNVALTGTAAIGSTLTGSYSYHDVDNDLPATPSIRWIRTNSGGSTVASTSGLTYLLTSADEGYIITFEVTPVASTGFPTNGTAVSASTSSPVIDPDPSVPTATEVCISGIRKAGEVLTGKYVYSFYKGEGSTVYRWLLNNTQVGAGTQYTITQSDMDSGQDIVFEVTPKSSNYIPKVGVAVKSTPLARIKLAQTNYSLADTAFVLVPNVTGGVFSGKGVSNGWFSPWNADTASKPPHTVTYDLTISNTVTTCSERATVNISVVPMNAYFVGLKSLYCYDDKPDTIIVRNVPKAGQSRTFTSSNPSSIIKLLADTIAIIDPNKKRPGISKDTLSFSYVFNNSYYPTNQTYTTDSVGVAKINNLPDNSIFCNNESVLTLYPSPQAGGVGSFMGPVTQLSLIEWVLDPSKGKRDTTVTYKFTHPSGCFVSVTVPIKVNPAPNVDFSAAKVCVINTTSDSIKFSNKTISTDPIATWQWEFFDAGGSSSRGSKEPSFLFTSSGPHRIKLTAITSNSTVKGCSAVKDTQIDIGFKPVADFTWQKDCYHNGVPNDSIKFIDATNTNGTTISWRTWKFGTTSGDTISNKSPASHIKTNSGYLKVTFTVKTNYKNCDATISKDVYIRPTYAVTSLQDYFENFENGRQGWLKDSLLTVNTWTFGKPNRTYKIKTAASGNNAWYTGFDIIQKTEASWVNSPCFDFSDPNLKRPMISMKTFRRFDHNNDGSKIQYTIGDAGTWQTVGTAVDDGINWYNSALIKGATGSDGLGWTDSTSTWIESRRKLDDLIGKKDVKFRVTYGSNSFGQLNDGFAFDDVRIGQRTRKVLFEHFTNAGSTPAVAPTKTVSDLSTKGIKDIINIQYHTDFPGTDAYFNQNPGDVSTRLLFYGLSRVPYAFVDGGTNISDTWSKTYSFTTSSSIDSLDLIKRSLISPLFSISIDTTFTTGTVTVKGTIKALSAINVSNATLYIAITEKQNSTQADASGAKSYVNIFKKFLPDAAGIALKTTWAANDSYTLSDKSWQITGIPNSSGIEIIAFVQNNITKEVYQAESVVKSSLKMVVGTDNLTVGQKDGFTLYPNPASDRLTITFEKFTVPSTEIFIYDYTGSVKKTYKVGSGLSDFTINDTGLLDGIYMVKVKSGDLDLGYKKLIISRK